MKNFALLNSVHYFVIFYMDEDYVRVFKIKYLEKYFNENIIEIDIFLLLI